jgi:SAM-dependent methyltransferase
MKTLRLFQIKTLIRSLRNAGFVAGVFLCGVAHGQNCDSLFVSAVSVETSKTTLPSTIGYYDSHAAEYNTTRAHVSPEFEKHRANFIALLPKGARILEIGAGHGRDAAYFQGLGFDVVATEPSVELSKLATEKIGRPVLNTKAQEINYDREFDAVWAVASLIHIPPAELPLVFENLKKAVKPGGIIHTSFLKGVGTDDVPEQIADGRYFNRASERHLREVVKSVGGLTVIEDLTRGQGNDYFGSLAPTATFGFFNLYLKRD